MDKEKKDLILAEEVGLSSFTHQREKILFTENALPETGGRTWAEKYFEGLWLAGGSISQPSESVLLEAEKELALLKKIAFESNNPEVFYRKVMEEIDWSREYFVEAAQAIFGDVAEESIVLEDSGRGAIMFAVQLLRPKIVLSASEQPEIVNDVLKGADHYVSTPPELNFLPTNDFFAPKRREFGQESDYDQNKIFQVEIGTLEEKADQEIIQDFENQYLEALKMDLPPELIVIPHATRIGRVLPIREISSKLRALAKKNKQEVHILIDAVQSIGRTTADEMRDPFDFCDMLVFGSKKGLGAQLASSCLLIKPDLLKEKIDSVLESSIYKPYLRYGQVSDSVLPYEKIMPLIKDHFVGIGSTELAGFSEALWLHFFAGLGLPDDADFESFNNRRKAMLADTKLRRSEIIENMKKIGLEVFDSEKVNLLPGMILFRPPEMSANLVKENLSQLDTPTFTSGNTFGYLRIVIPENLTTEVSKQRIVEQLLRPLLLMMGEKPVAKASEALGMFCLFFYKGILTMNRIDQEIISEIGPDALVWIGSHDDFISQNIEVEMQS